MNNNPLILQQLLENMKNQNIEKLQADPGVSLQNNLNNLLALGGGNVSPEEMRIYENNRQYFNSHHPVLGYFRDQDISTPAGFAYNIYDAAVQEPARLLREFLDKGNK